MFTIVLDRGRITSTVAVLTSFLAFSLLLGELIFSADCDLRVVHTKANLVEYVLVVDWASNVVRLVACVRPATGM